MIRYWHGAFVLDWWAPSSCVYNTNTVTRFHFKGNVLQGCAAFIGIYLLHLSKQRLLKWCTDPSRSIFFDNNLSVSNTASRSSVLRDLLIITVNFEELWKHQYIICLYWFNCNFVFLFIPSLLASTSFDIILASNYNILQYFDWLRITDKSNYSKSAYYPYY